MIRLEQVTLKIKKERDMQNPSNSILSLLITMLKTLIKKMRK